MSTDTADPAPSDAYPRWAEEFWVEEACRAFGVDTLGEARLDLERAIQALSDQFTTDRPETFQDYARDPRMRSAYGLFFFPQTYARTRFALRELTGFRHWTPRGDGPVSILDLGSGTGAAGLSAARHFQVHSPQRPINLQAIDHSGEALQALQSLSNRAEVSPTLETRTADLRTWIHPRRRSRQSAPQPTAHDLILLSFVLNELTENAEPEETGRLLEGLRPPHLRPGGRIIILEPALRTTSEHLEVLRNQIAGGTGGRWRIEAPCPHHESCPLLARGRYWCHEVRRWNPPESLQFLNRRLHRSVADLKFSFLILAPESGDDSVSPPGTTRLVSPVQINKALVRFSGCCPTGDRVDWEIQRRDLSREDEKRLASMERGDQVVVTTTATSPLQEGKPVRLLHGDDITRLFSPAD